MTDKRVTIYTGTNAPSVRLVIEDVDLSGSVIEVVVTPAGEAASTFLSTGSDVVIEAPSTVVWSFSQEFADSLPPGVASTLDVFRVIDDVREKIAAYLLLVGGPGDFFEESPYMVQVPGVQGLKGDKGDQGDKGDKGDPGEGDMNASMYDPTGVHGSAFLASNHTYVPTGTGLVATKTQAAITELAGKVIPTTGTSTPTPTASSGTLTSASSSLAYEKIGKRVRLTGSVAVVTAGTGTSELRCAIPFTCGAVGAVSGNAREVQSAGVGCAVSISGGGTYMIIVKYDGTTIIANSRTVQIDITYDAAS